MPTCKINVISKSFGRLHELGVLKKGSTKIEDLDRFNKINQSWSDGIRKDYEISNPGLLFNVNSQNVSNQGPLNLGTYRRESNYTADFAVINRAFSDEVQAKIDSKEVGEEKTIYNKITSNPQLKTWELGDYKGQPQTKTVQGEIDQIVINHPEQKVGGEDKKGISGESFNQFAEGRIIPEMERIVDTAAPNSVVLTHNSVFGLIRLWDKEGRPSELSKSFRTTYTKQDSTTGDYFTIKNKDGKKIYIVRHGQTDDNKSKINPDGNFRRDDVNLTAKGIEQASQVGRDLSHIDIPEIISSSLARAIHTSKLILDQNSPTNTVKSTLETQLDLFRDAISKPFTFTKENSSILEDDIKYMYTGKEQENLLKKLSEVHDYKSLGELLNKIC